MDLGRTQPVWTDNTNYVTVEQSRLEAILHVEEFWTLCIEVFVAAPFPSALGIPRLERKYVDLGFATFASLKRHYSSALRARVKTHPQRTKVK